MEQNGHQDDMQHGQEHAVEASEQQQDAQLSSVKKPDKLTKKEKIVYGSIAAACIVGIVLLLTLVILPRNAQKFHRVGNYTGNLLDLSECNFAEPDWIYGVMGKSIELYAMELQQNSSFVYMEDWGRLSCAYTTRADVEAMKDYYMEVLDDATYTNIKDDRQIRINGTYKGMPVEVVNYVTEFADIFEVTLDLDQVTIDYIRKNTDNLFPENRLSKAPEIAQFMQGEVLGGNVIYSHDELNQIIVADVPVASRIYAFDGDEQAFANMVEQAKALFGDTHIEASSGSYGDYDGYRIFLGTNEQDGKLRAVVNAQALPAE